MAGRGPAHHPARGRRDRCLPGTDRRRARGLGARDARFVPNGMALPAEMAPEAEPAEVLYAGRLSPEKGIEDLLAVADGLHLVVAGAAPSVRRCRRRSECFRASGSTSAWTGRRSWSSPLAGTASRSPAQRRWRMAAPSLPPPWAGFRTWSSTARPGCSFRRETGVPSALRSTGCSPTPSFAVGWARERPRPHRGALRLGAGDRSDRGRLRGGASPIGLRRPPGHGEEPASPPAADERPLAVGGQRDGLHDRARRSMAEATGRSPRFSRPRSPRLGRPARAGCAPAPGRVRRESRRRHLHVDEACGAKGLRQAVGLVAADVADGDGPRRRSGARREGRSASADPRGEAARARRGARPHRRRCAPAPRRRRRDRAGRTQLLEARRPRGRPRVPTRSRAFAHARGSGSTPV